MPSLVAPIPIVLDRPRQVKLTNAAIFTAERELSKLWEKKSSFYEILSNSLGFNDLSIILWQGLLWEDPSLTLERVQNEVMDLRKITDIVAVIMEAWNAATMPAVPTQEARNGDGPLAELSPGPSFGVTPVLS